MARAGLKPVSVAGIEFDALVEETRTMNATIPVYPAEDGFPVSDTIILEPLTIAMVLYVSNTPVTWLYRHGSSNSRVKSICDELESLWMGRQPVKIVTSDAIYTDMGLTSLSIKKSYEIGFSREVQLTAQKIRMTSRKTVEIPDYIMQSGISMASAGVASTDSVSESSAAAGSNSNATPSGSETASEAAEAAHSILYGAASGLGFI